MAEINKRLEQLEIKFKNSEYNESCSDALYASKLIKKELVSLKAVEPNYDWEEIRKVLLEIPLKYCPNSSKEN